MKRIIKLVAYDPHWPQIFQQEAAHIKKALGDNCLEIHHVGSTAVPKLKAKPIIDIIVVVKNPLSTMDALAQMGITYRGEYNIPLHYGFSKKGDLGINIHVYKKSHPEIELNLTFRDYLRCHPEKREEYEKIKESLILDESSHCKKNALFTNYTLLKGDFIRSILKEAGFNKQRIMMCNDKTEWKAAKHYRDTYFFEPLGIEDPYTWTFEHEQHAHLVLYQGTKIIGYAHIQFWPDNRAAIRIIAIDENQRNQNAGSQFLGLIEEWIKVKGFKSIHAESRQRSLRFYIKNGYTEMPFKDPENHESDPLDVPVGKIL